MSLDRGQAAHIILYIRDACQLSVSGLDVPPPLRGDVHLRHLNLSPDEHEETSRAWLEWWHRFILAEGEVQLGHRFGASGDEVRIRSIGESRTFAFDPGEGFASLADSPLLRGAAMKSWRDGADWFGLQESQRIRHGSMIPLTVAESVIRDKQVSPERVRAAVLIFGALGQWSHLFAPGLLLCSDETYVDESLFAAELRRAFESGIELPLD